MPSEPRQRGDTLRVGPKIDTEHPLADGLVAAYVPDKSSSSGYARIDFKRRGDTLAETAAEPARLACPPGLRLAVRRLIEELSDQHGGDHHDDECPVCRAIQDWLASQEQGR